MTEENKSNQGGDNKSNPPIEEPQDPQKQVAQPPKQEPAQPVDSKNLEARIDELNSKLDRYKEQVKGSSEEALRLKEENEKLKEQLEEFKESGTTSNADDAFQKIMETKGLQAAVEYMIGRKLTSLEKKLTVLETDRSEEIFEEFKASHKGLEDPDMLAKFDKEFDRLKDVYDDVMEAMEKAYVLVGGHKAESQSVVEDPQKKKAEADKVVKNATGGEEDARSTETSGSKATELQKQINDLLHRAAVLEASGRVRQAAELFTKVEELKAQLSSKV